MPVIKGEKTAGERFPGAVATYSIEAMMQDRKALQAGTSHFLGQNFAKAQEIKFSAESGELEYAWTTSWGVSTRLIGGLIMSHSDDDGLVLPPKLAPAHVVILPIYRDADERAKVLPYCESLKLELAAQTVRQRADPRANRRPRPPRRREEMAMGQARRAVAGRSRSARHRRRQGDARPPRRRRQGATARAGRVGRLGGGDSHRDPTCTLCRSQSSPRGGQRADRQPERIRGLLHAARTKSGPSCTAASPTATSSIRPRWTRSSKPSKSRSAACRSTPRTNPASASSPASRAQNAACLPRHIECRNRWRRRPRRNKTRFVPPSPWATSTTPTPSCCSSPRVAGTPPRSIGPASESRSSLARPRS